MTKSTRCYQARCVILAVAGMLAATTICAQQNTCAIKKKDGAWAQADKIEYRPSSDAYVVTKGMTVYSVPRAEMVDLQIPRPPDFDSLVAKLSEPLPDQAAIVQMENIANNYKMLKWDVEALSWLVPAYEKKNMDEKIVSSCDSIKKITGNVPEILLSAYWNALRRSGKVHNLQGQLSEAIEKGSRGAAAAAYMTRGDLLAGEGKKKEALIQAYLKVVILFKDVPSLQPEALYKVWRTMSDIGDRRGEKFKRKLLDEFPNSRYAIELK